MDRKRTGIFTINVCELVEHDFVESVLGGSVFVDNRVDLSSAAFIFFYDLFSALPFQLSSLV